MNKIKFKLYDKSKDMIVDYINYSIALDGEVQSFDKNGVMEGVLKNRHLEPILYTGKNDIKGKEIYGGFIVLRKGVDLGEEDFTGVAILEECSWWLEDRKKKVAVLLQSELAEDYIIGNIYQNKELANNLGF